MAASLTVVLYERWRFVGPPESSCGRRLGGLKPPHAALAEDRRGERCGKGVREASGGDQGDDCWVTCREFKDGIRTGLGSRIRDESGGCPGIGQAVSGIEVA
jgi:hypothetical protein